MTAAIYRGAWRRRTGADPRVLDRAECKAPSRAAEGPSVSCICCLIRLMAVLRTLDLTRALSLYRRADDAERKVRQLEGQVFDASRQADQAKHRHSEVQQQAEDLKRCERTAKPAEAFVHSEL